MKTAILIRMGVLLFITAFSYFWIWFMIRRPERWAALVDKENAFWVRTGVISEAFAGKCTRLEKGPMKKWLIGVLALFGTGYLVFIVWLLIRTGFLTHRL